MPSLDFDYSIYEKVIAQGCLTNSKHPDRFIRGVYPTILEPLEAKGCIVQDYKGNEYIDTISSLGSNLLGYGNAKLAAACTKYLHGATSISLPSFLEVEFALNIRKFFQGVDKIKILKSGTQACDAAIKIARAYTHRDMVLSEGYHGHGDDFISLTDPANGIPKRKWMKKLDPDLNDEQFQGVAAVIIEPVILDDSRERMLWLEDLRDKCDKHDVLLIFDEVITGLRYKKWSVSGYSRVRPDIFVLGKALANGLPLGVVGGSAEVMDAEYFVSTTFAGETLSLAAANALFLELNKPEYNITTLWEQLTEFRLDVNRVINPFVTMKGYATRGVWEGDSLYLFMQECCKAGILIGPSWVLNYEHIKYRDVMLMAFRDISKKLKTGSVRLEGKEPTSPFSKRMR